MINEYIARKDDYIFWKNVRMTNDHIFEFIKNKFPNSLILPEFNMIDWFVIDENLPIEIQSTIVDRDGIPRHAHFENAIRQQLEQNIINYGTCWFFFDEYYLKYLQKDIGKTVSINYDWLYKLLQEEKLKIFTVTHDGKIDEKPCNNVYQETIK